MVSKVEWDLIEPHYRAGIRSLKDIGAEFRVSDAAIVKHAKKNGWTRDLAAKIKAKADAKVSAAAVSKLVSAEKAANEQAVVEANAELQYRIRIEHRQDIGRTRQLFKALLAEVETATNEKNLFEAVIARIGNIVGAEQDESVKDVLMEQFADLVGDVRKLTSIGNRIDSAKKLTEILEKLVRMEREAFGITDGESGDGDIDSLLLKLRRAKGGSEPS